MEKRSGHITKLCGPPTTKQLCRKASFCRPETHNKCPRARYVLPSPPLPPPSAPPVCWAQTWCLFCDATTKESPAPSMADTKPKEASWWGTASRLIWRRQDRLSVEDEKKSCAGEWIQTSCDWQGLSLRQVKFQTDGQIINETDSPAQLEMKDENTNVLLDSTIHRQKTFSVRKVQFDSTTSWLVHTVFFTLSFPPLPFLCCTWSN